MGMITDDFIGVDDIVDIVDKLKGEIEVLKKENKKFFKYAEIMGDIDGDQLTDLLRECGWEYDDDGELNKINNSDEENNPEDYGEYMAGTM